MNIKSNKLSCPVKNLDKQRMATSTSNRTDWRKYEINDFMERNINSEQSIETDKQKAQSHSL